MEEVRRFKEDEPEGTMVDRMMASLSELLKQMELELKEVN